MVLSMSAAALIVANLVWSLSQAAVVGGAPRMVFMLAIYRCKEEREQRKEGEDLDQWVYKEFNSIQFLVMQKKNIHIRS